MLDQENILRAPAKALQDPYASEPLTVVLGEKGRSKSRFLIGAVIFLIVAAVAGALWIISGAAMEHLPGFWGISIASVLFWLAVTQGMIAISALLRLAHASWRYPLTRMLDIVSVFGFWMILVIPVLAKMRGMIYSPMSRANGANIIGTYGYGMPMVSSDKLWRAPASSSFVVDCIFVVTAYLAGVFLLLITSRPDFAVLRDRAEQGRRRGFSWLAGGWIGTISQWRRLRLTESFLIVGVVMTFFASQTVLGWDFQLAAGATWDSSIFPFQVNLAALMAGAAMLVLVMTVVRGRLRGGEIIGTKQYDALGKLLLAFGLLFFYFRWCDYITAWYGHTPDEWHLQLGRITRFPLAFVLMVLGCIILPIFANIFAQVRKSPVLLSILSVFVLIGVWCQKFLDTTPAFGYGSGAAMDPAAALVGFFMWIGVGALFLLTYFWAIPRFSAISWWGMNKWRTRSSERPLGNATVTMMVEDPPTWEN